MSIRNDSGSIFVLDIETDLKETVLHNSQSLANPVNKLHSDNSLKLKPQISVKQSKFKNSQSIEESSDQETLSENPDPSNPDLNESLGISRFELRINSKKATLNNSHKYAKMKSRSELTNCRIEQLRNFKKTLLTTIERPEKKERGKISKDSISYYRNLVHGRQFDLIYEEMICQFKMLKAKIYLSLEQKMAKVLIYDSSNIVINEKKIQLMDLSFKIPFIHKFLSPHMNVVLGKRILIASRVFIASMV